MGGWGFFSDLKGYGKASVAGGVKRPVATRCLFGGSGGGEPRGVMAKEAVLSGFSALVMELPRCVMADLPHVVWSSKACG